MSTVAGATLSPGVASAIGTLTFTNPAAVTNNFINLTLAGTTAMDLNRAATFLRSKTPHSQPTQIPPITQLRARSTAKSPPSGSG